MAKFKRFMMLIVIALVTNQSALAEENKFSDQVLSVAYGFGFCHHWVPGYVWRDNRDRIIKLIGVKHEKLIESYYDKGIADYNKKGFDYKDRETCNLTINMLIKKLNEKTDKIQ